MYNNNTLAGACTSLGSRIIMFNMTDSHLAHSDSCYALSMRERLMQEAMHVAKNSYSPYSNFPVGCALLLDTGEIASATNVENASFGLTMRAERSAVFTAVAKYGPDVLVSETVAYASKTTRCNPCGACLSVLHEFGCKFVTTALDDAGETLETHELCEHFPFGDPGSNKRLKLGKD